MALGCFGYIFIRSPYIPYSIYLRGTIRVKGSGFRVVRAYYVLRASKVPCCGPQNKNYGLLGHVSSPSCVWSLPQIEDGNLLLVTTCLQEESNLAWFNHQKLLIGFHRALEVEKGLLMKMEKRCWVRSGMRTLLEKTGLRARSADRMKI